MKQYVNYRIKAHNNSKKIRSLEPHCTLLPMWQNRAKKCKTKQQNKVNIIMQAEDHSDEEVFTFTGKESAHIAIEINGKIVSILIDSGSSINAMDKHKFDSLNSSQVVKKTTTTMHPYGSKTPLKLIGKSTLNSPVNDKLWEI